MNTHSFSDLSLTERVLITYLKGEFISQWQVADRQTKLYFLNASFLEIHYHWEAHRGMAACWVPCLIKELANDDRCNDLLTRYAEQISLDALYGR